MLTGPDNMQPEQQSKTGRYVALRLSKSEGKLSMSAEFESLDSEAKELPGRRE